MAWLTLTALLLVALLWFALEARIARRLGEPAHSGAQIRSNMRCGALRLAVSLASHGMLLAAYATIGEHLAAVDLSLESPGTWVLGLVLYDLAYYWEHRLSHRHGLLWSVHSVHHQATDFNLSVGFRTGLLGPLFAFPFFVPLALVGVPVEVYAGALAASTAVLFFTHSRLIGDLGVLGALINNPATHRRHHAAVVTGVGTNFAGIFMVWDRLFGTYAAEPPVEGCGLGAQKTPRSAWAANAGPIVDWLGRFGRAPARHAIQGVVVYGLALSCGWAALRAAPDPRLLLALAAPTIGWMLLIAARRRHVARPPFFQRAWPAAIRLVPLALPLVTLVALYDRGGLILSAALIALLLALLVPTMARGRLDLAPGVR